MVLADDLRKAVLQTALQGKLTQQLPEDSNVDELLKRIKEEKELLAERKNARKDKDFGKIEDTEIEFDIPASWRWIRVGDIGVYKKGPFGSSLTKSMFVPKGSNAVKVYEQKNAIQKDASLGEYYITREYYDEKMSGFQVEPGDIIVSCAGTIGETYVMPEDIELGIINQALMRMNIAESINLDYFLYYFDHVLKTNAKRSSNGSAIKNIPPFDVFKKMLFPVPPIEEQQRIVEKLDSILAEIDEYSIAEQELTALQVAFPDDVRKSILQYAMQGKLVEQRPEEGTGEELYQQIQEEKNALIKAGKIKKEKPLPEIVGDDTPFDIPDSWKWVRFGDIVDFRLGKTPPRTDSKSWGENYKWVSISDMVSDGFVYQTKEGISQHGFDTVFGGKISPKGTLIMSFKLTIGCVSILNIDALHNEAIISIFPIADRDSILRDYLFKIMPYVSKMGDSKKAIKGSTLNSKSLKNLMLPLPPLCEQQRIVKKLDIILPHIKDIKGAK